MYEFTTNFSNSFHNCCDLAKLHQHTIGIMKFSALALLAVLGCAAAGTDAPKLSVSGPSFQLLEKRIAVSLERIVPDIVRLITLLFFVSSTQDQSP